MKIDQETRDILAVVWLVALMFAFHVARHVGG